MRSLYPFAGHRAAGVPGGWSWKYVVRPRITGTKVIRHLFAPAAALELPGMGILESATMKVTISHLFSSGRLAQLVRAPALQAGGRRFESCTAHHSKSVRSCSSLSSGS